MAMKKFTIILIASLFYSVGIYSQSQKLKDQIAWVEKDAANKGYTLLDSGPVDTNNDWVLTFDTDDFRSGYYYHVITYLEGCSYCDVGMYFQRTSDGQVEELTPTIERSEGVVQATYQVHQTSTVFGLLSVYAKSSSKVYTYSMLFRRLAN
jgi:hypothetical protein